jgi:predicted HicB family RNase H-like nuclease
VNARLLGGRHLSREKTVSLNLRVVPESLVRRAKSAAALEGKTMREWIMQAMEEKLKRGK